MNASTVPAPYGVPNNTVPSGDTVAALSVVSAALGWICTAAWSLSFYPQVYINWRRRSVVGLSFDFVAFDFVGFVALSTVNVAVLWIPKIQTEYTARNLNNLTPVAPSDVVFSLHGLVLISLTLVQCIFYDRGGQKVSEWTRVVLVVLTFLVLTSLIVPGATAEKDGWAWIYSLLVLSYVKVAVTVFKYWPQVHLNYRRRSTEGWSIHNVLLDFVGGWLSLVQMFIDALVNHNQWPATAEAIAKYWLCIITLVFDALFLIQHYALYGPKNQPLRHRATSRLQSVLDVEGTRRGCRDSDGVQGDNAVVDLDQRGGRRAAATSNVGRPPSNSRVQAYSPLVSQDVVINSGAGVVGVINSDTIEVDNDTIEGISTGARLAPFRNTRANTASAVNQHTSLPVTTSISARSTGASSGVLTAPQVPVGNRTNNIATSDRLRPAEAARIDSAPADENTGLLPRSRPSSSLERIRHEFRDLGINLTRAFISHRP